MIVRALKYPFRIARQKLGEWNTYRFVAARERRVGKEIAFDFTTLKSSVLQFVDALRFDESGVRFKYSQLSSKPSLYASAYACMTYSLLGRLGALDKNVIENWVSYFDSFQSARDGLFYDPVVQNEYYNDSDWWGARHLAVHMISAYTQLGAKPRHPFKFLSPFYDLTYLEKFLQDNVSAFDGDMNNDFDNKLMNLSCVLQYQRDFWNDKRAGEAVRFIQEFLLKKVNPETGIWGDSVIDTDVIRSRKVQFAYHLFPLFLYDNIFKFDIDKVAEITLLTQNKFGGYGVKPNSSACDDIDSIDILVRFTKLTTVPWPTIEQSLQRGMRWNLLNQVDDGGFVFRLNEGFMYGHAELSSMANQGAIFPTWFRTLNMAYLCKGLGVPSDFKIVRCPGYEF